MPSIDKKYYHNLDLDSNEIKAGRIYNLTTTQRNALSLTTTDKGYLVYDITLLSLFVWNGTAWVSAGGAQNLQQVTTTGNTTTNNIVLNSTTGEYPNNAIGQNIITDSSISIDYSSATSPFNHTVYLGGSQNGALLSLFSDNNGIGSTTDIGGGGISIIATDSFNQAEIYLSALDSNDGSAFLQLYNVSGKYGILKVANLTNTDITLQFPNEITGSYTIPTNVNGTYADSTGKITLATAGFEQNFLLMGA
jgi:hypothetical protein